VDYWWRTFFFLSVFFLWILALNFFFTFWKIQR
jgi:hypothetical protein